jgi:hypothetical protein
MLSHLITAQMVALIVITALTAIAVIAVTIYLYILIKILLNV